MEVNCHNLTVNEAIKLIRTEIDKAYEHHITQIKVIHGSNHGAAIKKRLRGFKSDLVTSMVTFPNNPGVTIIYIKMKLY